MITHITKDNGFEFFLNDSLIALGHYNDCGLELCENDHTNSTHTNGMLSLTYLREKYTPEYYQATVKEQFTVASITRIDNKFKKHPALQGVYPLANRYGE